MMTSKTEEIERVLMVIADDVTLSRSARVAALGLAFDATGNAWDMAPYDGPDVYEVTFRLHSGIDVLVIVDSSKWLNATSTKDGAPLTVREQVRSHEVLKILRELSKSEHVGKPEDELRKIFYTVLRGGTNG